MLHRAEGRPFDTRHRVRKADRGPWHEWWRLRPKGADTASGANGRSPAGGLGLPVVAVPRYVWGCGLRCLDAAG